MRFLASLLLLLGLGPPASAQVSNFQNRVRAILRSRPELAIDDSTGTRFTAVVPTRAGETAGPAVAAGRAFSALAAAYVDLKIGTPVLDSANLMLGNAQFSLRGDLGGKSLAIYFECGSDVNGVYAEIYTLSTSLVSLVTPLPADSVEVRTVLFATAINIPKPNPTRECKSTGELEKRLVQAMVKRLGKSSY